MYQTLINCNVIDGTGSDTIDDAVVELVGERIEWVGRREDWTGSTEDGCVRDMKGAYILPGLWDMHVHLSMTVLKEEGRRDDLPSDTLFSYRRALAFLDAGVTSLRLVGSPPGGMDFALRDGIAAGRYMGPRILTAGQGIASTGGHGYRGDEGCDGPYEFRKAARKRLWQGADLIKIMVTGGMGGRYETYDASQTLADEVKAATEVAHNAGRHVAGHIASPQAAIMCAEAGVNTVEHGYVLDERSLSVMAERGTAYVPTLVVSWDPSYWQELGVASWAMDKIRAVHQPHRRAVELALELGTPMAIGTDLPTAHMDGAIVTVREMEIISELGAQPRDLIGWASSVSAGLCGLKGQVGELAPGQVADIIAVPEDPSESISNLRDVRFVMTGGRVVKDLLTGAAPVRLPEGFFTEDC